MKTYLKEVKSQLANADTNIGEKLSVAMNNVKDVHQ